MHTLSSPKPRTPRLHRLSLALVLCTFFAFGLTACSEEEDTSNQTTTTADTSNDSGETVTTTDELSLCLPQNPARPSSVLQIVDALKAELKNQGDPTAAFIGIMPNHKSGFWDIPLIGFNRAKQEIGFNGEFHFPPEKTEPVETIVQGQLDTLAAWTTQGVQGIGLSCKNSETLSPPIKTALDAGIPVITFDSDSSATDRHLYLGTLNEAGGRAAGDAMIQLLQNTTGKVIVLAGFETELNSEQRVAGIQAAFSASPDQLVILKGTTDTNALEVLDSAFTEHGDQMIAILTLNGTFGPIAGDWVVSKSLKGTIKIGAWDLTSNTQRHVEDGVIQLAFAQRAYFYGYLSSYVLYSMHTLGVARTLEILQPWTNNTRVDMGLDIISADLLPDYQTYQLECLNIQ